jgi:hypothetical protein
LIEVPLHCPSNRESWLVRLFVRYLEWDHDQDLHAQLGDTLDAMQRGMMSLKTQSPGYLTLVNHFDHLMGSAGESWADWLIVLVPRSWLLYKPSRELAEALAERAGQLLKIPGVARLEEVAKALDSAWTNLAEIESEKEPSRWRTVLMTIEQELRGGRG